MHVPVLLLLCLSMPAAAQVELVDAGIICPRAAEGVLIEAPGTESGVIRQIEAGLSFDLPDRTVPTLDQLSFGFRTTLAADMPETEVVIVVTHPPMGDRGVEREEWADVLVPGSPNLNLFTFEAPYEKVIGPWTFSVEIDGITVLSVPFDVTEDGNRSSVEQTCFQFLS